MTRANIQIRIWLSIGIFILGFLFTTVVSQVEQRRTERGLAAIADAVMPAAQNGRDAEAAFERVVKAYNDAIVMEDRSGLERGAVEGARTLESLNHIGAMAGVNPERGSAARRLAAALTKFLADAKATYGSSLPAGGRMTAESQGRMQRLAARTTVLQAGLRSLASGLSRDLQARIDELRSRSAAVRAFMTGIFIGTLVLAVALVNLTIRRSILAPLEKAQEELARERDLLRILMDHIPDCIYFKDAESKFLRVNRAQAALMGVKDPAEALGHSDADYFDAAVYKKTQADEQRILETGEPLTGSIEHITGSGVDWWVTVSKVRVHDEAKNTNMIVGISKT